MKIHIFCVGGTIDKVYFDAKSKYEVGVPAISNILHQLDVNFEYSITSLMAKDSLEMTDEDRSVVAKAVAECAEDKIIITHGTDTMPETARSLVDMGTTKTIILTGALAPAIFKDSDALFNIGGALAAAQSKSSGVFIVMNGYVFDALNVRKDVENNCFVDLN